MLGPHVDEVELLFFESRPTDCLPTREEIGALSQISKEFSLGYNIHLPTDVSLAEGGREKQDEAIGALLQVMDLTAGLDPTSWTLHIPSDAVLRSEADVARWQGRARAGLEKLLDAGIPSRRLVIENLDYPFGWVRGLVQELDLGICMDVGHLLVRGEDITAFYRENADRIAVLHLHGARNGKDHLPLMALSKSDGHAVFSILKDFSGTLSLEMFSREYLGASMEWLEEMML
jgi:sugar phosphate isomerase/epimerase